MAVARIEWANPWALAKALHRTAQGRGPRLDLVPFNQFEPTSTTWWLSPCPNPAYKAGKIGITEKGTEPELMVGLYIEKGVGQSAAPAFTTEKDRRLLMREDWIWNEFSAALSNGDVTELCKSAAQTSGSSMIIAVDAQAISPSEAWYQARYGMPRDFACFFVEDDRLTPDICHLQANVAPKLAHLASVSDLPALIHDVEKPDWIWFDVHIGYRFAVEDVNLPSWDSETIWDVAYAPWSSWIRL